MAKMARIAMDDEGSGGMTKRMARTVEGCMELVWSLHGALEACMETGIMGGASSTSQQNHSGARATKHHQHCSELNSNITAWRQKKHRQHLGKGCTSKPSRCKSP